MKNSIIKSLRSQATSAKVAVDGFPWLLATVLYTLSWGWSLLRPNTLYWDDWAYIYNKPKSYLNQIFVDTGLPPWRALIDQELIAIGYWTIPVLTFLMFFFSSLFLHNIFKKFTPMSAEQIRVALLIALLLPVNHSRISLQMFGYTTSYFLFFLAWMFLLNHRKQMGFWVAVFLFFWSFMTHSFLFFYLLPVAHYLFLKKLDFKLGWSKSFLTSKVIVLFALPPLYYILRHFFWPPTKSYETYHKLTVQGAKRGVVFFAIGATILLSILVLRKASHSKKEMLLSIVGWMVFAWGLFPYFINESYIDMISVFAFRADWGSRHLLLTPLGAGLLLSGLALLLPERLKTVFIYSFLFVFTSSNLFFGSQYFIDSNKKEQLAQLFQNTNLPIENKNIIFIDETKIFNGRNSTYRNTELIALVEMSGTKLESISGKNTCEEVSNGIQLTLMSKKSYLRALASRDLELYFETQEC